MLKSSYLPLALQLGANATLKKPFTLQALRAAVNASLERQGRLDRQRVVYDLGEVAQPEWLG